MIALEKWYKKKKPHRAYDVKQFQNLLPLSVGLRASLKKGYLRFSFCSLTDTHTNEILCVCVCI